MLAVYKFNKSFGRSGDIYGIFTATAKDIQKTIGKIIYFGEILGKHSEIEAEIEDEDYEFITDDENFINIFIKKDIAMGINPLDYYKEEEF